MALSKQDFKALLEKVEHAGSKSLSYAETKALAPYKVKNAIVLAAGLSSRFAPLSYDTPKGLLKVKGEVLIERQIRQLKEAGIDEIYVVVGYKRELFFYLEDAFGVHIVYNPEYARKNNISSIWAVRDKLDNSYICSADNYFDTNPFKPYVYQPYYACQLAEKPTREWLVTTDADGRISNVSVGGEVGWFMIGEAYFDKHFSKAFRTFLEAEYNNPEIAPMLWEDFYVSHIDDLTLYIKKDEGAFAHEFDSLDELIAFDSRFLENADSAVFDNICEALGCEQTEIHDVYPLTLSLTNLSCHFATNSGEYVYRHPGIGTEDIIDRENEKQALEAAREAGLDHTFLYANPKEGWKISRFVPEATSLNPHVVPDLKLAMKVAKKLHNSDILLKNTFNFDTEANKYQELLQKRGGVKLPEYKELACQAKKLSAYVRADQAPVTVNHNDFFYLNFLVEKDGTFNLIDWEYAGMGDYANDLATFSVCCQLNEDEVDQAIQFYFDNAATQADTRHVLGVIGLCGWCWYLWSLLKERDGDNVGEWLYIYYHYAKKYCKLALSLYEQDSDGGQRLDAKDGANTKHAKDNAHSIQSEKPTNNNWGTS